MITTYFMNCIMGNVFRTQTSPAIPSTLYVGLSTTTPSVSGSGVAEPSGGSYSRVALSNLSTPSNGTVKTTGDIAFPESSADWGTITHYVIYDALTGGHLLAYESLDKARVVQSDTQCRFSKGNISITLQNKT